MKPEKWSQSSVIYIVLLIVFSLITYFFKVNMPLTDGDTAYYGHIAYNIVRTGDWQSLHFNDVNYNNPAEKEAAKKSMDADKPPLSIWPMAVSYLLFGFSDFATKAWHALLAVICILLCFRMAREFCSPRASFWAGAVFLTMVMIFYSGQVPQQDVPAVFCIMLSFWGLIRFFKSRKIGFYYLFWLGMGLGMLNRGIPAIFYFLGPAFLFWILYKYLGILEKPLFPNKSRALLHGMIGVLVFLISGGTWFFLEYLRRGPIFLDYMVGTGFLRFANTPGPTPGSPFWMEFPLLFLAMIPWTGFIWHAVKSGWERRKESDGAFFLLLLWFVVALGMAIVSKWRVIRYLLPCLPPLAIFIGGIIDRAMEKNTDKQSRKAFQTAAIVNLVMAILFSVVIYYIYFVLSKQAQAENIKSFVPVIVLFLIIFNLGMLAFIGLSFAKRYSLAVISLTLLSLFSYMVLLNGVDRHIKLANPWPEMVSKVGSIRRAGEENVYLNKGSGLPFLDYYLRRHPVNVDGFANLNREIAAGKLQGVKRFYLFSDFTYPNQEVQKQISPATMVKLIDSAPFGQSVWQITFNR